MTNNDKLLEQFQKDLIKKGIGIKKQLKNGYGIVDLIFFGLYIKGKKGNVSNIHDHRYFAIMKDYAIHTPNDLVVVIFGRRDFVKSDFPIHLRKKEAMDFIHNFYVDNNIINDLNQGNKISQSHYNYYFDSFIPNTSNLFDFDWSLWK